MSSNGRADEMMVQLSGIAREGNSQFIQIKQDDHVKWDEADAINRWLLMEVFCKFLNFVWLIRQCLFNVMFSFNFSEAQDVDSDSCLFTEMFRGMWTR